MDWMNNLFVVLLLTTITGTIFYAVGVLFQWIWFRNDIRPQRLQMRMTQWAFLMPFVYGVLYLRTRIRVHMMAGSHVNLFYNTPAMRRICAGLGCAWLSLFLVLFAYKVYVRYCWIRVFQGNIPEEDSETEMLFRKICEQLGVTGKVSLYRNDSIRMPCITYSHGFAVVLPLECYTREETAVILYHELCHYLNRDLYVKTVSCFVSLLHVINPFVHIMLKQLSLACEEYCDRRACLEGAAMFNEQEYFQTIFQVLVDEGKRERYNLFTLADTIGEFERRVKCMKRYQEHGSIKKGTAIVLSVCFLLGSSVTALAAGDEMTDAYTTVAGVTDSRTEENEVAVDIADEAVPMSDEEVIEEFARMYDLNPEDVVMMGDEGIETVGNFINIEWDVPAGKTFMTSGFSEDEGNTVSAMTIGDPSDIKYQMGIKDPNELMRYVEGTGHLSHDFAISIKGRYYFFTTNLDSSRDILIKATVIK